MVPKTGNNEEEELRYKADSGLEETKQAMDVPHGVKKSTCDAWNGYHSVAIREEDRHLTTFLTPEGRYRYRTAPQGFLASGDGYTHS